MDETVKKRVMLGVSVCCVVIAILITVLIRSAKTESNLSGAVQMLCQNAKCAYSFEISEKEFKDMIDKNVTMQMGSFSAGQFKCPKCEHVTVSVAEKCQKCNNVFVQRGTKRTKCPKCGHTNSIKSAN